MGPPPPEAAADRRPGRLELADMVRTHGARYQQTHRVAGVQRAALRAIAVCRTAVLGGHRETCDRCDAVRITYHSCLMVSIPLWGVQRARGCCGGDLIGFLSAAAHH